MKKITVLGLIAGLAVGSFVFVDSADAKGRVNNRQYRQQRRIAQGVNNDSLTGREAARLQKQQARLAWKERQFRKSGGGLSPVERAKLEAGQDNLSQNVYQQKHDGQTAD
ncbi:MAG: hypothetical protein K2Z81_07975 [Cyanobacteria bacterium]|nr:hypothetical protein [Cyanobacteriota bacterium]